MDLKVKKLIHCESRMVIIEVQSSPPICICNVYIPCRNSKGNAKNDDNFQSCLEQIEEVLSIYQRKCLEMRARTSRHRVYRYVAVSLDTESKNTATYKKFISCRLRLTNNIICDIYSYLKFS